MTQAIEDILAGIVPAERTVTVCIRGDLGDRIERLQAEWQAAIVYDGEHNEADLAPALFDRIAALEAEAAGAEVEFLVRAIGAPAWRRLVAEHPPSRDDLEGWRWDVESFPPAALAASAVDPPMTEDQAVELAEHLSNGQWGKLFAAVLAVNCGDDLLPKSVLGTIAPPISAPRSTTALLEESLTVSSPAPA